MRRGSRQTIQLVVAGWQVNKLKLMHCACALQKYRLSRAVPALGRRGRSILSTDTLRMRAPEDISVEQRESVPESDERGRPMPPTDELSMRAPEITVEQPGQFLK